VDLCYRRDENNLDRLAQALAEIHPKLRGAPADLPFRLDSQSLALGSNFTFTTELGALDLLGWVEPIGAFEQLEKNCEVVSIADRPVKVIGLDDLIRVKRHIRRRKDEGVLADLEDIQRLRNQR
jgi:hypothetical protein